MYRVNCKKRVAPHIKKLYICSDDSILRDWKYQRKLFCIQRIIMHVKVLFNLNWINFVEARRGMKILIVLKKVLYSIRNYIVKEHHNFFLQNIYFK